MTQIGLIDRNENKLSKEMNINSKITNNKSY